MKKISILFFAIAVISTFGFVSINSTETSEGNNSRLDQPLTILKGAEKSGVTQTNQNW